MEVVQRMLGHKSAQVTLDTDAALFPDDLDNVVVALNRQGMEHLRHEQYVGPTNEGQKRWILGLYEVTLWI
ncbi:hypothetical protein [Arthrobacter sp. L77]|uniref:hypothetical protein n=1 Tax=Arthrobacter sp. L77 TaxID=1496689 RepID=UPI003FA48AEE